MELQVGDSAPNFKAPDQTGYHHQLSDYKGRWLVIYFYPKDYTSGCTKEACDIRDNFAKLDDLAIIIGVSGDSVKSHQGFANKHDLPYTLLADPNRKILDDYGANGLIMAKRSTFIIDPDGKIAKIYSKVKPEIHAQQLIKDLQTLQAQ
jgi:peroxiredoxin Q/BCP